MNGRSLEFRLSQLADGTLPVDEQASLTATLQGDPQARQTFEEYRRLQTRLDRTLSTPSVRWDMLASEISSAVAASAEPPAIAGRIAGSPAIWRRRLAVAASLLLASSAGLLAWHGNRGATPLKSPAAAPTSVVIGPQAEQARGTASVQISIGPSPALADQGGEWRYAEGVVTAPARVQSFSKAMPATADDDAHLH